MGATASDPTYRLPRGSVASKSDLSFLTVGEQAVDTGNGDVYVRFQDTSTPADDIVKVTGSSSSGGLTWQVISTDTTASAGNGYLIDVSASAVTLTLPGSPSAGNQIAFKDYTESARTNDLLIDSNGNNINGSSDSLLVDINGAGAILVYSDSTNGWELVTEIE